MVVWKSSLALNNCFSYRKAFQNGVNALSKMVFKPRFLTKTSKFRVVWTIQFCSNCTSMWSKYLSNNVWRDFRLPMSALATVLVRKSFNGKFTAKIDFPIGYFILPLLMLTLEVWNLKSLHTLFDRYLDHMLVKFEQNHMVWTIQNFELFDKKRLTIFDKVLTSFWKTCDWNNSLMLNY